MSRVYTMVRDWLFFHDRFDIEQKNMHFKCTFTLIHTHRKQTFVEVGTTTMYSVHMDETSFSIACFAVDNYHSGGFYVFR